MGCNDCGFCRVEVVSRETSTFNEHITVVYGEPFNGISIRTFCAKGKFNFRQERSGHFSNPSKTTQDYENELFVQHGQGCQFYIKQEPGAMPEYYDNIATARQVASVVQVSGDFVEGDKVRGDKIEQNGSHSQLNFSQNGATVNATQNNGYDHAKLQTLIDRLLQSIPNNSPQETKEQVKESLEVIQTEVQSPCPRKDIIKTKLAELGNGIIKAVDFLTNLAALANSFRM